MVGFGTLPLLFAASLVTASPASPTPPKAVGPKMELGTSIANVTFLLGSGGGVLAGVPAGIQSFLAPSAYLTAFMGSTVAVEPQFGFIFSRGGGTTAHILNLGGNIDCFLAGTATNSPYIFGGAGVVIVNDGGSTTSSHGYTFGGGAGVRIREGDRFVVRISGGFTRLKGEGNIVSINVSIGGTFGGG